MANELSELAPRPGSRRAKMRIGRGEGSGKGTTAGRGTKGDGSRGGFKNRPYFEGGQMPLHRRLPKKGFNNVFAKDFEELNLEKLAGLEAGATVTAEFLHEAGLVSRVGKDGVKLLGRGDVGVALHVKLAKVSAGAREKIVAAGGTVEELAG
jgi:large subunit ribosomal protein L15